MMTVPTLLACVFLLGVPLRAADICNPEALQGTFGFQISGNTTISGESQPVTSIGRIVLDGEGGISGYSSVMFAGLLLGNPVTGTYEASKDCTVSWSLQDDSGAFQHFSGVATADANRVRFRQTDPGTAQNGVLARTADACKISDLRQDYDFQLSGSFTPMSPGDAAATLDAKGRIASDAKGNFILTLLGNPAAKTLVTVTVDPDCTAHFDLALPSEDGKTPALLTLRGIVVDGAKQILAIQTDPGWMLSAKFTAR
jgi:hypothetical protein